MSDQSQTVTTVPVMRSDKHFSSYANGFSVRVSAVDVTLIFLQNSAMPGTNISVLIEEGMVSMALPVFKQLTTNLSAALAALEDAIGPIRIDAGSIITQEHLDTLVGPLRNVKFTD